MVSVQLLWLPHQASTDGPCGPPAPCGITNPQSPVGYVVLGVPTDVEVSGEGYSLEGLREVVILDPLAFLGV